MLKNPLALPSDKILLQEAARARRHSHSPYSRFPVGAALLARSGKIYRGSNVESGSYGLTMCAERVAMFKAISEGEKRFWKIAIAGPRRRACAPCGACRQVLWEFEPGIQIVLDSPSGKIARTPLRKLLPSAFERP